ncbi:tRNA lysidine(34) synthetase TilS [Corynebacterium sp. HMSC074A01]|uniref:tRNA lysidine(34) synthetase TilS n=1 Tax=Corynebacterium sp. HMSC074A01 TaxID=1715030 RepID=UPI0008A11405|nr:tRNA lysidine(34) synthetase TilS [Corynebacterium sp. HMSC074A01]OHF36325.1 tRNA lysidine(34) synthetase TilS [Corynebacterium sp. HMSC074A01]
MASQPFWPRTSPHFLACRRAVRAHHTDAEVTIGLSGGPDSLALVAAAAAEQQPARAVVVDHGLQPGSAGVAKRAAAQARALGVPAEVVAVSVDRSDNLEAAAREARYAALFASHNEVWVAHTADDQAETLLLGALRGNPAGMEARAGRLVRPFLHLRRADTVGACAELGLTTWDDPMNQDPAYRRVAIRTQIIPALTELLGGDAVPALASTADRIAQSNAVIRGLAQPAGPMRCDDLKALPGVVRRSRIHAWLVDHNVHPNGAQLDAIERLVTHWRGQVGVDLAQGVRVRRVDGTLQLTDR